ncbi:MAG TPA: HEPN domain-containing protein [Pyrinomonadaceae bacterium]|jgi:HEPN domain-containing protein
MNPITREWIDKAEGDWATANREYKARKNPNYDAVCFHAQQCAEKYLKACMQEKGIGFRKIHDLEVLLGEILPTEPGWAQLRNGLIILTTYAVEYRYPGAAGVISKTEA